MVTIRNATKEQIDIATGKTSQAFDFNVEYNRFEQKGKNFFVTLKVKDSHGKGARRGYSGRAMYQACWHVYGTFFDELIAQNDKIVIVSMSKKISKGAGNWVDSNVGSMANPRMYSEMCECDEFRHGYENTDEGA